MTDSKHVAVISHKTPPYIYKLCIHNLNYKTKFIKGVVNLHEPAVLYTSSWFYIVCTVYHQFKTYNDTCFIGLR